MKIIGKTATLNLRDTFSQIMFHQYRVTTYNKFMKHFERGCLKKKQVYLPLHKVSTKIPNPHIIMEVKSHLNTSSVRLPVISRVSPPYLKCIHMVEKYACSRDVIHSLTNNANMECWPSMLKMEFRNLILRYGWVVFHNNNIWKKYKSSSIGWLTTINSWNNIRRDVFTTKESLSPITRGIQLFYTIHPKIKEPKTHLHKSRVKFPVTSRVNHPYLKCIYMVEKHANSRDVIHSVSNNVNIAGWPWILSMGFRSLIRCYGGVVFHNLITWKIKI